MELNDILLTSLIFYHLFTYAWFYNILGII
jgi:hypothetical protein